MTQTSQRQERPVIPAGPRLRARAALERARRRRRHLRAGTWVALTVTVLVLISWVVLISSLLGVHRVTVTGQDRLTRAQIAGAAGLQTGTPLARLSTSSVAARVRALPGVSSVTVTRGWPRTVHIAVHESPVLAAAQVSAGKVLLLDEDGDQVGTSTAVPRGVVRLVVHDPSPTDATTRSALAVLASLPPLVKGRVGTVTASSPSGVVLVLRDGRKVVWGDTTRTEQKAAAVLALLRYPSAVYDVSAPGVATRR